MAGLMSKVILIYDLTHDLKFHSENPEKKLETMYNTSTLNVHVFDFQGRHDIGVH